MSYARGHVRHPDKDRMMAEETNGSLKESLLHCLDMLWVNDCVRDDEYNRIKLSINLRVEAVLARSE